MNYLPLLENKRIVVLGLGLTGMSFVRYLHAHGYAFSANDSRTDVVDRADFNANYPQAELVLGHWAQLLISQVDILLVSPGVDISMPAIKDFIPPHGLIIGDVELYCRLKNSNILAVTGSNGKSTVVSLLAHIATKLGLKVQLGGNFGIPVLDLLDHDVDVMVLELSSFQLETLSSMNAIAATVLNVSDDHLDRHQTLENYRQIKAKIYGQCQTAIVNRDDVLTQLPHGIAPQSQYSFGSDAPGAGNFGLALQHGEWQLMFGSSALLAVAALPLAGIHNALNCLAALAMGHAAGWDMTAMVAQLPGFTGLAHRCQLVDSSDGIIWINDSKATNVGAALAAINGLVPTLAKTNKLILIAGGEGKGADFSPLKHVINQHVALVIALGKDGGAIAALTPKSVLVASMAQAVSEASKHAQRGDVVLLSPACASIDMFTNFSARGQAFVDAVKELEGSC